MIPFLQSFVIFVLLFKKAIAFYKKKTKLLFRLQWTSTFWHFLCSPVLLPRPCHLILPDQMALISRGEVYKCEALDNSLWRFIIKIRSSNVRSVQMYEWFYFHGQATFSPFSLQADGVFTRTLHGIHWAHATIPSATETNGSLLSCWDCLIYRQKFDYKS